MSEDGFRKGLVAMGEPLTAEYVSKVFGNLTREGGETAFMNHVVEDVSWTVKGTHPLAGHYSSKKAFKVCQSVS